MDDRRSKKRVAILTHSLEGGGAERVISNLSRHIGGDCELILLLLDVDASRLRDCDQMISLWSQDHPVESYHGLPFNPIQLLQMTVSLRREVKRNDFSMVLSFLEIPNFLNLLTLGRHQRIVSVRNHMSGKRKGFLGNVAVGFVTRFTDHTIAASEMSRRDLIENFGAEAEKVSVLPNPVDVDRITEMRDEGFADFRIPEDAPVIVNVARLTDAKGHDHLIRCFCKVREKLPEARLLLVGEGDKKKDIADLARSLGVGDHVIFAGFQENPYRLLSRSDVFVLSSHYEGFPNALLEAMACRVPIISTDCLSGPRELLSPSTDPSSVSEDVEYTEYGILVPPWREDASDIEKESILADTIVEMLSDKGMRNRYISKGGERVKDFSVSNVIPLWNDFIQDRL